MRGTAPSHWQQGSTQRGQLVVMGVPTTAMIFPDLDAFARSCAMDSNSSWETGSRVGIAPARFPRCIALAIPSCRRCRLFFSTSVGDFHCGLRGFDRKAIQGLNLRTTGMEFASGDVVKASLAELELPKFRPRYRPTPQPAAAPTQLAGRLAPPRFLLMFAPGRCSSIRDSR